MLALRIEAFDRCDLCPGDRANRGNARSRCASFYMHGASTAKTDSATEFRSCETKLVADYPEQRGVVRTMRRNGAAVEIECRHDRRTPFAFCSMVCRPFPSDGGHLFLQIVPRRQFGAGATQIGRKAGDLGVGQ